MRSYIIFCLCVPWLCCSFAFRYSQKKFEGFTYNLCIVFQTTVLNPIGDDWNVGPANGLGRPWPTQYLWEFTLYQYKSSPMGPPNDSLPHPMLCWLILMFHRLSHPWLARTANFMSFLHWCSEGAKIWSNLSAESQEVLRPQLNSR